MRSSAVRACLLFLCLAISPSVGIADGLSREQGDAILDELRRIRVLLEQPLRRPGPVPQAPATSGRIVLKLGGGYSLGRADAPVTIVEYTDYQCPFCARFQSETYPDIRRNFIDTGKVRFIRRDLPMNSHPNALKAAQASRCAGDQGKFREMHDLLSANPFTLGPESYARFARELSLDAQAFNACLDGDRHLADIRASMQEAAAFGIRSTPSFVIGTVQGDILDGVGITGAQPYTVFEKTITDFLKVKPVGKATN